MPVALDGRVDVPRPGQPRRPEQEGERPEPRRDPGTGPVDDHRVAGGRDEGVGSDEVRVGERQRQVVQVIEGRDLSRRAASASWRSSGT